MIEQQKSCLAQIIKKIIVWFTVVVDLFSLDYLLNAHLGVILGGY